MSNVKPIPEGCQSVTPYLVVEGASGLMDFLAKALDAKTTFSMPRPDGSIMHAEIQIGNSRVMMADANEQWKPMVMNLHVYVEDVDRYFKRAIEAGGKSLREPANQFYGDRSGGFLDPCGNMWWLATHVEDVSEEEMERRFKAQSAKQ
jgi:uncharacterized glyoxalase superfamily protein PhnB